MLTLKWKITMSLSYYIAYEKNKQTNKQTNAMIEKIGTLSITILTSRKKNKWPYLRKFLI